MRLLFALPGFHLYERGAEVALLAVAEGLGRAGDTVTVMGSGQPHAGTSYAFIHVPSIRRERFERFPRLPALRSETAWEDASFAPGLLARYRPANFDAAITCSFPFTHWALRRPALGARPLQIFVTQNGDWPAYSDAAEFKSFACDGLVCTNPDYQERNAARWRTALIPNGIDPARFTAGAGDRAAFGLPPSCPVVLMVSALIESKRVVDGIRAVARLPDAHLVVAGDGPLRREVDALAAEHLPGRFTRLSLAPSEMPLLYRSADAFLHLSLLESFGNVFVEAMASGLPIVGHDTARLRWIVGADQPLCDSQDPAALEAALREALRRGRGAPDPRARNFHWDAITERYRDFLAELQAARRECRQTNSRK